jgi:hypothetical protein
MSHLLRKRQTKSRGNILTNFSLFQILISINYNNYHMWGKCPGRFQ